jgi:hypothetical protein
MFGFIALVICGLGFECKGRSKKVGICHAV